MTPTDFYKCLAEDTRLHSLLLLSQRGELCVCDLVTALALSQPKISRHLAQLRECQLVEGHKRGKWVYYRLHPELPEWMCKVLHETGKANSQFLAEPLQRLQASDSHCC